MKDLDLLLQAEKRGTRARLTRRALHANAQDKCVLPVEPGKDSCQGRGMPRSSSARGL